MLTLDVIEKEIKTLIEHGTNYEDCARLANLYLCKAGMTGFPMQAEIAQPVLRLESGSEFVKAFSMAGAAGLTILDEMFEVLRAVNPNLYIRTLQALQEAGQ